MLLNTTKWLFSPRMRLGKHTLFGCNSVLIEKKYGVVPCNLESCSFFTSTSIHFATQPFRITNSGYLMQRKIVLHQNLPEQSRWQLFQQLLIFHSIQHVPAVAEILYIRLSISQPSSAGRPSPRMNHLSQKKCYSDPQKESELIAESCHKPWKIK